MAEDTAAAPAEEKAEAVAAEAPVAEAKEEAKSEEKADAAPEKKDEKAGKADQRDQRDHKDKRRRGGNRRGRDRDQQKEFEESILRIARVTRVVKGGRRMRFQVAVVIGDKKGRVGFGIGKSGEVLLSIQKAVAVAKKNLVNVPIFEDSIPHNITATFKATKVMLMPAPEGTGVIAGGAVRTILDLAGIKNVLSKSHGSRNAVNLAYATFRALEKLRTEAPKGSKKQEGSSKEQEASEKKEVAKKEPASAKASPEKEKAKKAPAKKAPAKK